MDAPTIAPLLGNLIRTARIDAGMTQTELANKVNAKQSTVSMWESGKQRPRITQIGPVAHALGIDSSSLLAAVEAELA